MNGKKSKRLLYSGMKYFLRQTISPYVVVRKKCQIRLEYLIRALQQVLPNFRVNSVA